MGIHSDEGESGRRGGEREAVRTGNDGHVVPVQERLEHGLGRHAVQGVLLHLGAKDMVVGEGAFPHANLLAVGPWVFHDHLRAHSHLVGQQGPHPHPDPHLGLHGWCLLCVVFSRGEGKEGGREGMRMHHGAKGRQAQ